MRFEVGRVQYRPLGFQAGEVTFTFVFCATERGDKFVPRNACAIGLQRKTEIEPTVTNQFHTTSTWSKGFVDQLKDPAFRHAYMADQVRLFIALQVRALREQQGRGWSQRELGEKMGKAQSAVARLEDPDYGRLTLQSLLELAAAF